MKKEYPYLKQFFEQHKTKHSYKSFVRHRSTERLKQLDEICSNHPYKTRFEEYLKLSDKETFAQKIYKVKERIDVYWFDHDNGAVIGCLFFMVLLLLSLAGKSTFIISLKILSVFAWKKLTHKKSQING